jgi:hypothetical protein
VFRPDAAAPVKSSLKTVFHPDGGGGMDAPALGTAVTMAATARTATISDRRRGCLRRLRTDAVAESAIITYLFSRGSNRDGVGMRTGRGGVVVHNSGAARGIWGKRALSPHSLPL